MFLTDVGDDSNNSNYDGITIIRQNDDECSDVEDNIFDVFSVSCAVTGLL